MQCGWRLFLLPEPKGGMDVRITFHVWKYTVTIVIRETKRKAQNVKNNRHSDQE